MKFQNFVNHAKAALELLLHRSPDFKFSFLFYFDGCPVPLRRHLLSISPTSPDLHADGAQAPQSAKACCPDTVSDSEPADAKVPKKARAEAIPWAKTPVFGERFVEWLTDNPTERTKLLGDSTEDTKAQGRRKKQGKDSKDVAFGPVTKYIFDRDQTGGEREWQAKYQANTSDFVRSTIQFWGRLKTEYSTHAKTLKQTGGGLKEGDAYSNQIEKISNEFPLWDQLHPMLNKIPSIVPPGISNSEHGQDHSGVASSLFASGKSSLASSEAGDGIGGEHEETDDGAAGRTSDIDDEYAKTTTSPIDIVDSDDEDERLKAKPSKKVDTSGPAGKRDGEKRKSKAKKDTPALGDFDVDGVDALYSREIKETSARRDKKMAIELKKLELQILQQKSKDKQREQAQQASMQSQQMMGLMATFMQNYGGGQPGPVHTASGSAFGSASVGGSSQFSQAPTPLGGGLGEWLATSGSPERYRSYGEDVLGSFGDDGQGTSTDTFEQPAR